MGGQCAFVARGSTTDEVIKMMIFHAKEAHPEKFQSMSISEEEMNQMMISKMKDA